MSADRQRWLVTIAVSILIHFIFCVQAVAATRGEAWWRMTSFWSRFCRTTS
jgi:hypothetical protein